MNTRSEKALHRIQENDPTLTELNIGRGGGLFQGATDSGFSLLGTAIEKNTHLTKLAFGIDGRLDIALDDSNSTLYYGLTQNSSIHELTIRCYENSIVGVGGAVLNAFQANNNLTQLEIYRASIHDEGEQLITKTLRRCTNLKVVDLSHCGITDEQLLPMVEAVRGGVLQNLCLYSNNIGNVGCEALAALLADTTLLGDSNCNLHTLDLRNNPINHEGSAAIANGLANNKMLFKLDVDRNAIDQDVEDAFSRLLCDTSSINNTFTSHHALLQVTPDWVQNRLGRQLESLLMLNREINKRHVAMKKILIYHPEILTDIVHLFEWESEDKEVKKLLPDVIAWYGRAAKAVAEVGSVNNIKDSHLLSAVYQFARAIPTLFVPELIIINNNDR